MLRPVHPAPSVQTFATRTPTLPPATHTNSYALGERDVLLVEPATPYEDERREWLEWARGLHSAGRNLVAIVLTHHHGDHIGGAEHFARELGVPVWAHAVTAERLHDVPVARRLEDGESIVLDGPTPSRWNVLLTPGHAPGHVCLHEPDQGLLIAGDMVATVGTILVEPSEGDMQVYVEQLARLRALETRITLPAHGDAITDPDALFERYIRHRGMREHKVLAAVRAAGAAGATVDELVPVAYDDTPRAAWPFARMSLAAHLVKLVREGLVSTDGERHRSA